MRRKETPLMLVIKAWCVEFRLLCSTQSPAAGNHGQPIWALNERNGWPVPAPLKTHLHPVRFHYAARRWEWTESGRNAGLCSTRPCKLTASLHQTFFPLWLILVSLLHYFLLLLCCFSPHCQLVMIRDAQNPIFALLYNYLVLTASVQD